MHGFEFGEEAPVVELIDICDPWEEFYEEEDEGGEDGEVGDGGGGEMGPAAEAYRPCEKMPAPSRQQGRNPDRTRPTLPLQMPDQLLTPFLSRTSTPGIPGGTSNLSYFHLPLGAGRSGTTTPLPGWGEQQHIPTDPTRQRQRRSHQPTASHNSNNDRVHPPLPRRDSTSGSTPDRSGDIQTSLHITYTGALSLSLTASILLDYPMPSFVSIPLKLQITGLSFDGVALLAYLQGVGQQGDEEVRTVHFCFLGREEGAALVGGSGGGGRKGGEEGGGGEMGGGLLKEIRVESEIGRQEDGKQVLKNVGKVEKFVLEQVRRIFEEELVWPSFWSFLV